MMRILATVILGLSPIAADAGVRPLVLDPSGKNLIYQLDHLHGFEVRDVATGEIKKFAPRYSGSWLRQADASGARARGRGQTMKMTSVTPFAAQRILGGNQ
jgi:hypothetical protein